MRKCLSMAERHFNKSLLFFLLVILSCEFKIALAESNASEHFNSCNEVPILQDLLAAANQGDALAHFMVGVKYLKGKEVKKNGRQAFEWFQKSADQSLAAAQFFLGKMYAKGKDIEKNDQKALEWLTKAAKQGYPVAKANRAPEAKSYSKAFKKLIQLFQPKKETPLDANVKQLSSFKEALSVLETFPQRL